MNRKVKYPVAKILKKITIMTIPKFSKNGIRPYIDIMGFSSKDYSSYMLYSSKAEHNKQTKYFFPEQ